MVGGAVPPPAAFPAAGPLSPRRWCAARCRPGSCTPGASARSPSTRPCSRPAAWRSDRRAASSRTARPFAIPETMDAPEPLAIAAETAAGAVLLALPLEPPGGASFDPAHAAPSGARYRGRIERVRDAVQGGAEPEEIEIARPAALLLAPGKRGRRLHRPAGRRAHRPARRRRHRARDGFLPPALATRRGRLLRPAAAGGGHRPRPHRRGARPDGARRRRPQRREPAGARARQRRPAAARPHARAGRLPPGRALPRARRPRGRMATYGSGSRAAWPSFPPTTTSRPARPSPRWPTRCAR